MISLEWKLWLWLILGVPLSIGWLLIVAILVRPQTRRGLAYWVLPAVAVLAAWPLLWLAWLRLDRLLQPTFYTLDRMAGILAGLWWVVPVAATLGATGWLLWRYWPRRVEAKRAEGYMASMGYDRPREVRAAEARALADSGVVPVQPAPAIWSLPDEYRGGSL